MIKKLLNKLKGNKRHYYLVTWEAMDNNNNVIKGRTEVNMPFRWHPDDVYGVMGYIASLNDGGVGTPIPINIFYIGKFKMRNKNAES